MVEATAQTKAEQDREDWQDDERTTSHTDEGYLTAFGDEKFRQWSDRHRAKPERLGRATG